MKSSRIQRESGNDFLETPHSNKQRIREKEKLSEDIKYLLSHSGPNISKSWRSATANSNTRSSRSMRCWRSRRTRALPPKNSTNSSHSNLRPMSSKSNSKTSINKSKTTKGKSTPWKINSQADSSPIKCPDWKTSSKKKPAISTNSKTSSQSSLKTHWITRRSWRTTQAGRSWRLPCWNTTIRSKYWGRKWGYRNSGRKRKWRMPRNSSTISKN